jgi:lipopolysaccharide/colanic/teichoic acid biosynthesis glycosyltransferase
LVDVVLEPQTIRERRLREPHENLALSRVANRRPLAALSVHVGTLTILTSAAAWHAYAHGYWPFDATHSFWLIAYFVILSLVAYAAGIPDATGPRNPYLISMIAAGSAAASLSVLQLTLGLLLLPRLVVFMTALGVTLWWGFCATAVRRTSANGDSRDHIVFVGRDDERDKLRVDLTAAPERRADVVAAAPPAAMRAVVVGDEPLVDRFVDCGATMLVLGHDAQEDRTIISQVSKLHEAGVRVRPLAAFYDEWLGKLPISELQRISLMFDINEIHGQSYARVKRMLDIVIGMVGCVALVVVTPVIWFGDLIANRGPLVYRQPRVGRGQRTFSILKFRTMVEGNSTDWTSEDDPRITPFGRFLRRMHLDELPQFVNIVRGELSIVGPRPEQPRYVSTLEQRLPYYQLRHLVRPGLTGWAQVKYGYAGSERDALEKLQYDFYYLGHQSLMLDLRIIARTVRSTLLGREKKATR